MALPLKTTSDFVVAENDPFFPDIQNKELRFLWAAYTVQHNEDGTHIDLPKIEEDTYAGTGAAQTISLTDTTLTPIKWLWLFSENDAYLYFVTDTMPSGYAKRHDGIYANYGITLSGAGFTLTAASVLNTNAIDYYYVAWGIGGMGDPQGSNASPPTWIEHGDDIEGGTGKPACQVEEELYDDFIVEHTEAGIHNISEWDVLLVFETGTFAPDGSASQEIELEMTETPSVIWFMAEDYSVVGLYVTAFGKLRLLQVAALTNTGFVTPAAGKFTLDGTVMGDEIQFLGIYSDTLDGSTDFEDSTKFANEIQTTGVVTHSTDQPHTGATSIKFNQPGIAPFLRVYGSTPAGSTFVIPGDFRFKFSVYIPSATPLTLSFGLFYLFPVGGSNYLYINCQASTGYAEVRFGTDSLITSTTVINDDAWHDIELSRIGETLYLEIDGAPEGSYAYGADSMTVYRVDFGGNVAGVRYYDDLELFATLPYFMSGSTLHYVAMAIA